MTTLQTVRERPIPFTTGMVQALLRDENPKTQTRRICKRAFYGGEWAGAAHPAQDGWPIFWYPGTHGGLAEMTLKTYENGIRCPYGKPGDLLWVREPWKTWPNTAGPELRGPEDMGAIYKATWDKSGGHGWKSPRFMPRWASRILLELVEVRVQRVQEISEADARAEGVTPNWCGPLDGWNPDEHGYLGASTADPDVCDDDYYYTAREAFAALWNSINEERGYAWDANPWAWVLTFKRVQP